MGDLLAGDNLDAVSGFSNVVGAGSGRAIGKSASEKQKLVKQVAANKLAVTVKAQVVPKETKAIVRVNEEFVVSQRNTCGRAVGFTEGLFFFN